jgi:hypothetical protein
MKEDLHVLRIVSDKKDNYIISDIGTAIKSEITIDSEASLDDMLYAFERFLEVAGYYIPKNSRLDFVDEYDKQQENDNQGEEF